MQPTRLIKVSAGSHRKTEFRVSSDAQQYQIKHAIQVKLGIPQAQQRLVYQRRNAINLAEIFQHNLEVELKVVMILRGGTDVIIKFPDGRQVTFEVDLRDTRILKIKEKIQDYCGCNPDLQKLYYQGRLLQNQQNLQEFTDQKTPKLDLLFQTSEVALHLTVLETGQPVVVYAEKTDSIREVKENLSEKLGLPSQNLRISHMGQELSDSHGVHPRLNSKAYLPVTVRSESKPESEYRQFTLPRSEKYGKCRRSWHKICCCLKKKQLYQQLQQHP